MFKHKYLTRWEYAQMKFWAKLFVWSCIYRWPRFLRVWFDKQYWKQLSKVPK